MKNFLPLGLLVLAAGCNPSAPTTSAPAAPVAPATPEQKAVVSYVQAHTAAFPDYQPLGWGRPVVYTKAREAAIKGVLAMKVFDDALVPRNQALANYKGALARHAPPAEVAVALARYGKANKYNDSLLVIANRYSGVRDSTRLGTELAHVYRIKNKTGALVTDSATFVVYKGGKVEQL
ncbi:hypothetical protein HHL22_21180 [Hymenobacter sp. RP-2-7]|uniref:Lipoprotein n=1 Tax=Hymenobacter polaris TaxID=2682546 RepID=A0A7Y0FP67_9BACT|nr:hypothetical protein [Hymenobacter polaris]NML67722.1 hypothetical protein [Hymenobacter polaris]